MSNEIENEKDTTTKRTGDSVGVSHVIGVSQPGDKFKRRGADDVRSVEELSSIGVEPDARPTWAFAGVFFALVAGVALSGVGVMQLFFYAADREMTERTRVDSRLLDLQAEARTLLDATAEVPVEGVAGRSAEYRFPVADAIRVVAARPELLAGHPFGGADVEPPESSAAAPPVPVPVPVPVPTPVPAEGADAAQGEGAPSGDAPTAVDGAEPEAAQPGADEPAIPSNDAPTDEAEVADDSAAE